MPKIMQSHVGNLCGLAKFDPRQIDVSAMSAAAGREEEFGIIASLLLHLGKQLTCRRRQRNAVFRSLLRRRAGLDPDSRVEIDVEWR